MIDYGIRLFPNEENWQIDTDTLIAIIKAPRHNFLVRLETPFISVQSSKYLYP